MRTQQRNLLFVLVAAGIMVTGADVAMAQFPSENHFKVYWSGTSPVVHYDPRITLTDQWMESTHSDMILTHLANPTEKLHDGVATPIINPLLHHTWWSINQRLSPREITVTNQFGSFEWVVRDARYVLLPALKNARDDDTIPVANHYKCYDADGPDVNATVTLTDQFVEKSFVVRDPEFFCNPAAKFAHETGTNYPIEDENAHLACYRIFQIERVGVSVTTRDQFGTRDHEIGDEYLLCVPSWKNTPPVPVEESTWGQMKVLYRDK